MITPDDIMTAAINEKIKSELQMSGILHKLNVTERADLTHAVRRILASFGVAMAGEPIRFGRIDQTLSSGRLCMFFFDPTGARVVPLRVGQKIDVEIDGTWRTVEVIADEKGKAKLDISDDVPVIGANASMSAAIAGTEHLRLNPASGEIEKIKKLEGGHENGQ